MENMLLKYKDEKNQKEKNKKIIKKRKQKFDCLQISNNNNTDDNLTV